MNIHFMNLFPMIPTRISDRADKLFSNINLGFIYH
jgi:hypothetical protein